MSNKETISFEEYLSIEKKLDIRIGKIITAERIPKSKKLLKFTVIFAYPSSEGATDGITKTVVTNLGDKFEPEAFLKLRMPFILNLIPSTMMGVTSEAMILFAANDDGSIHYTSPDSYDIGAKLM